jgi:type 2 lantibiotic biosynthesis protein LanM
LHALESAWLDALATTDAGLLTRRLEWDGLATVSEADLLTPPPPARHAGQLAQIARWLQASKPIGTSDAFSATDVPFWEIWHRIASAAVVDVARRLPLDVASLFEADAEGWGRYRSVREELVGGFTARLAALGEAVFWEEFNRVRTPLRLIRARLEGEENRQAGRSVYLAFLETMRSTGFADLCASYPVFGRHLATTVDRWSQASLKMLTRLAADRDLVIRYFGLPHDSILAGIRQHLSDPHRGGLTVAELSYRSDSEPTSTLKVMYKPKDLSLDDAFQRLLARLPPLAPDGCQLETVDVLPRVGYGYMRWVEHRPCRDADEFGTFYRNAGRLTALLHVLGCTDCHHENLIAHGDQLFLVDAETLFEGLPRNHQPIGEMRLELSGLHARVGQSVLRSGLLPQWHLVGEGRVPRDVSALGVQSPPERMRLTRGWVDLNSDAMMAGEVERPAVLPTSLPVGIGSPNRLFAFTDHFCDGFERQLVAIADDRAAWVGPESLLVAFRPFTRRFVARPTWIYAWLQRKQIEPDALKSETAQRLVLERLARSYLVSPARPANWPMFTDEVAQMEALDVPLFEHRVDALDMPLGDGNVIEDFFDTSGYDAAKARILGLDAATIALEVKLVRGVILAKHMQAEDGLHGVSSADDLVSHQHVTRQDRRAEIDRIARALLKSAMPFEDGSVEWLGINLAEDTMSHRYGPLGRSLYDGRSGIALFLAALAQTSVADADRFRAVALGACFDLRRLTGGGNEADRYRWWRDQPFGLAGSGGILLALLHLRTLLPELARDLSVAMPRLLDALRPDLLRSDRRLDVIHGVAGLIGALLRLGSQQAIDLARVGGDHLVSQQHPDGGWLAGTTGGLALTGFSHGASGIAAALAKLHSITGDTRYLEAAAKGLRYEREHFDAVEGNWPDFRAMRRPPRFMLSWCHGAPGIALGRLLLAGSPLWDASVRADLDIALETTVNQNFGGDSLCCGRFGRAAILRFAGASLGEPKWSTAADRLEQQSLLARRQTGRYNFLDTLGLFTGCSGVGLALIDSLSPRRRFLPDLLSAGLLAD